MERARNVTRETLQRQTKVFFRPALAVVGRCVEIIDADGQCVFERLPAIGLRRDRHQSRVITGAKGDFRNIEIGFAEWAIPHIRLPCSSGSSAETYVAL